MLVTHLKKTWKEITLLGIWLASVAGSFILPLPSWSNSQGASESYLKFIIFIASILGIFLVLYSLKNHLIRRWFTISILFLLFLIASFTSYSFLREELTLPYESTDVVIGTVRKPNDFLTKLEIKNDGPLEKDEILKHFQGNSEKVWTKESIKLSRFKITFLFTLSYIFTSCFIISFSNLIILYKKKYDDEKFK